MLSLRASPSSLPLLLDVDPNDNRPVPGEDGLDVILLVEVELECVWVEDEEDPK